MTIPIPANTYTQATGTATSNQFKFVERDPGAYDIKYPLYTGWVNTQTFAIWYLESFSSSGGVTTASWRAVGPIVVQTRVPISSDYLYPIGQTWVDTTNNSYWVLVDVTGTTATWIQISGGGGNGIDSITGNSGGAVFGDASNNVNLVGQSGEVIVTGNPGTNTLTISLAGGSTAIDSVGVDAFTAPGTNPVLPTSLGLITVTGGQTAAGTTANVIRTDSLAANTYTIEVQRSQAVASTTVGDNGVCHFSSNQFALDSNAFTQIQGGTATQVLTSAGPSSPAVWAQPGLTFVNTYVASSGVIIIPISVPAYAVALLINLTGLSTGVNGDDFSLQYSIDGGSTYVNSGYFSGLNGFAYNSSTPFNYNSTTKVILAQALDFTSVGTGALYGYLYYPSPSQSNQQITGQVMYYDNTQGTYVTATVNSGLGNATSSVTTLKIFAASNIINGNSVNLYYLRQ